MGTTRKTREKEEFGDFQTPMELAREVCALISQRGFQPNSVIEPTCGRGSFLIAALDEFPTAAAGRGFEINQSYVNAARLSLEAAGHSSRADVRREDFFKSDWKMILDSLPDPLLIIGNPPWVTNAALGNLKSTNLPAKTNFQEYRGIEAITGKANFDISEWMLIRSLEWMSKRRALLAMLCKTAVARKVLFHSWKTGKKLKRADIYQFDASTYFGATVEACLLVAESSHVDRTSDCRVHEGLNDDSLVRTFGYREGELVADVEAFEHWKHLEGPERYKWRSGIKHDCSRVMELTMENGWYRNGMGELVRLEDYYVYPMLKSSDVVSGDDKESNRWMLVTQRSVGEETHSIRERAPRTWEYLKAYAHLLDSRSSSIYRKRPRFSIFGVGDYSFALWKVAISGFYKKLVFRVVGPRGGKPTVLDDTCYFIACQSQDEAQFLARLLNSRQAREFYSALTFWDAKRPITVAILRRMDLRALAAELGFADEFVAYSAHQEEEDQAPYQLALNL